VVGCAAGNVLHLQPTEWINFLAGLGSILLTFLAGAEIDPDALRRHWKPASAIGVVSFLAPFLGALGFAQYVLHWSLNASKIAGAALSTTSVAIVYAVMIETGLHKRDIGKLILAACFITDLGTVLVLGIMFAHYNAYLWLFVGVSFVLLAFAARLSDAFLKRFEGQVSEPEMKLLLAILLLLGGLASLANSEAVLPAYLLGLAVAGTLARHRDTVRHFRVATFALLTPFYFLKAGALIGIHTLVSSGAAIALFLGVKLLAKSIGVYPVARKSGLDHSTSSYTTLLMSTGLTFGTISAMFGLNRGYISQSQYSILVTVVILSAVIPTVIAQKYYLKDVRAIRFQSEDEAIDAHETAEVTTRAVPNK
jgi:Kef-type K+ transport system membrane component KefB